MYTIAIHPDKTNDKNNSDSSAPYWIEYLQQKGCRIKLVDAYSSDIIEQVRGCQGFMWRWLHGGYDARIARRIIPVIENYLHIPCFPDLATCWHYDDKVAQKYLFEACQIPHPKTWYFTDKSRALHWVEKDAVFPLVLKLSEGAGSTGVTLIHSKNEAIHWLNLLFDNGIVSLNKIHFSCRIKDSIKYSFDSIFKGWANHRLGGNLLSYGYILFQEFLPNNNWDIRVTIIGNRAFAFRRYNRENDFRASGSGLIDYNLSNSEHVFIKLGFDIAKALRCQSIAIDGLWNGNTPVVVEISYTYVQKAIFDSPGYWTKGCQEGEFIWHGGHIWPGTAQAIDFWDRIKEK